MQEATDAWNSHPNIVFEENDKTFINDMTERGGPIRAMSEMDDNAAMDAYRARQQLTRTVAQAAKRESGLPQDSTLLFAPRNNSTRDIGKASAPDDLALRELNFARLAALALGVPPAVLLQVCSSLSKSYPIQPQPLQLLGAPRLGCAQWLPEVSLLHTTYA